MTAKTDTKPSRQALPADLAAVALIDAPTCAAAGAMSVSWWHEEVRAGRAPAPAIRKPRCTRWRLSEVRAYWHRCAELTDSQAASGVKARATKASAAAQAKRNSGAIVVAL